MISRSKLAPMMAAQAQPARTFAKQTKANLALVFKCPKCEFHDADKSLIKKHLKDVHKAPPFACPHCQVGFSNFAKLQAHVKADHVGLNVPKEPYLQVLPSTLKQYYAKQVTDFKAEEPLVEKVTKQSTKIDKKSVAKKSETTKIEAVSKSPKKAPKKETKVHSKSKPQNKTEDVSSGKYDLKSTEVKGKIVTEPLQKAATAVKVEVSTANTDVKPKPPKSTSTPPIQNVAAASIKSEISTTNTELKPKASTEKAQENKPTSASQEKPAETKSEAPQEQSKVIIPPTSSTVVKPKVESVPLSERSAYVQQAQKAAAAAEPAANSKPPTSTPVGFTSKLKQLWTNLTTQQ